jgi:hypothetical protein
MKHQYKKKTMTFGRFVAGIYGACGRQKARGVVQRAVNEHWIEFRGKQRFLIS